MDASEFKKGIKEIKENLKGITIQFVTKYSVIPYHNLKAFGEAVLKQEAYGNDFYVSMVWTPEGTKRVNTLSQLKELFTTETITGVSFSASYSPKTFEESIRYGYKYND